MNKLMVAAATVLVAAITQAATVTWTMTNVQNTDGATSGIMYFINNAEISRTSILALAGAGADAVSKALTKEGTHAYQWSVTSGTGTITTKDGAPTNAALGLKDATSYDFYAVVFDTATITDASNFFVTDLKTGIKTSEGTGNKVVGFGSQAGKAEAWNAVAAPEPTSALLLLLGMAGLALRRKQA